MPAVYQAGSMLVKSEERRARRFLPMAQAGGIRAAIEMNEFSDLSPASVAEEQSGLNGNHHVSLPINSAVANLGADGSTDESAGHTSWGPDLPPLRMTEVRAAREQPEASASAPVYHHKAPRLLRVIRALAGVSLLLLAWGATTEAFTLGSALPGGPPQGLMPSLGLVLYVLSALGTAWLAVVALACVVAGAFALSLALSARGW